MYIYIYIRERYVCIHVAMYFVNRHLDRVAAAQGVELQGALLLHADVGLPDVPLRVEPIL